MLSLQVILLKRRGFWSRARWIMAMEKQKLLENQEVFNTAWGIQTKPNRLGLNSDRGGKKYSSNSTDTGPVKVQGLDLDSTEVKVQKHYFENVFYKLKVKVCLKEMFKIFE